MAQFARPDGTTSAANITGTPDDTNRHTNIDETTASDTDYVYGGNNLTSRHEVTLSDVTDPGSSTGHTFRYRIARTNSGTVDGTGNSVDVTVALYQGPTLIATDTAKTATGTWTTYSYTLTGTEADAITDYTALRLRMDTTSSGGSPSVRRGAAWSWAEFEIADPPAGITGSGGITIPAVALSGSAIESIIGSGGVTVPATSFSASGSASDPGILGTGGVSFGFSLSGSGTHSIPPASGSGGGSFGFSLSGTGTVDNPPSLELLVNGIDLLDYVTDRSISLKNTAYSQTGVLSFQLQGPPGAFSVAVEDEVILGVGSDRFYAGKVRNLKEKSYQFDNWIVIDVDCQDYTTLLSDDVIDTNGVYDATLSSGDKARIEDLITTFGTKGVTAGAEVLELRATMPTQDFTGKTLAEAIADVLKLSDGQFYVDYDKKLHTFDSSGETNAAPFSLSDDPDNVSSFGYKNLQLPQDSVGLKNAVYVIPGGDLVPLWYEDAASIATYGRREAVIKDERVTVQATQDAYGAAFLADHANPRRTGSLTLYEAGLRAGMDVQITSALHGLVGEAFRIVSVTTTYPVSDAPTYQIEFGDEPITLAGQVSGISAGVSQIAERTNTVEQSIADLSVGGANLLLDSSFEIDSSPAWEVGSLWVKGHDSQDPFNLDHTARLVTSGTASGDLATVDFTLVDRTDDWWFSFWSYLSAYTAGEAHADVREYDINGVLLATNTITIDAAESGWTRHSLHFGPNDVNRIAFNADTDRVKIAFYADTSPTLTWEIDGVQLERGNVLTAYAPYPSELLDGSVGTTKIEDGSVTTEKLIANAVTAGKIAAGSITAEHIAASGISADALKSGSLTLGGLPDSPDVLVVYDADGEEIGRWGEDGLLITDASDSMLKVRLANGVLEFSSDGGTSWTTAITGEGISADAIQLGTFPGGQNNVPNSGFELREFATALSKLWTSATDWQGHLASTDINLDDTGSSGNLRMTTVTY
jgi:hypothetical protein